MPKGGDYEREVCKQFSLWWSDGKRDDIFWRTAGSGGRATIRAKSKIATANSSGDMCYLDDIGKPFIDYFLPEIKRGYTSAGRLDYKKLQKIVDDIRAGKLKPYDKKQKNGKVVTVDRGSVKLRQLFSKTKRSGALDPLDSIDSNLKTRILEDWREKANKEKAETGRKEILIIFRRDGKNACVLMTRELFGKIEARDGDFEGRSLSLYLQPTDEDMVFDIILLEDFFCWTDRYTIQEFCEYSC